MPALPWGISPRDAALCCGLALLGAAAFPPLGVWPLSLAAIALLLMLLRNQDGQTARSCGLLFGFTYALATMYWFCTSLA